MQIPYCKRSVVKKLYFWVPSSFFLTYMIGVFFKNKDPTKIVKLPFSKYAKMYFGILAITSCYSFAESLLF